MLLTRRSQNYLSGDASRMDGAADLADETLPFRDPGQEAINALAIADEAKVEVEVKFKINNGGRVTFTISVSALEVEAAQKFRSTALVRAPKPGVLRLVCRLSVATSSRPG